MGAGYCRLQMPQKPAIGVRGMVDRGWALAVRPGGGGGFQCVPPLDQMGGAGSALVPRVCAQEKSRAGPPAAATNAGVGPRRPGGTPENRPGGSRCVTSVPQQIPLVDHQSPSLKHRPPSVADSLATENRRCLVKRGAGGCWPYDGDCRPKGTKIG